MFQASSVLAAGIDWVRAKELNDYLSIVKQGQVKQLQVAGDLAKSKIAWKISTYSQAIRYRLIELTESCINEWEQDRTVVCMILARALLECVAVLYDFENRLAGALITKDLKQIDDVIMNKTFSTKLKDLFDGEQSYEALNILTVIKSMDKVMDGNALRAYEGLSEYCHTNYLGVSGSYEDIDYSTGDVSFGNQNSKKSVFDRIQAELGLLELVNLLFGKIDHHVKKVAEIPSVNKR